MQVRRLGLADARAFRALRLRACASLRSLHLQP